MIPSAIRTASVPRDAGGRLRRNRNKLEANTESSRCVGAGL